MKEEYPEVSPGAPVSLSEISDKTVRAICRLAVRSDQEKLVASNAISIAQAHFNEHAWFRAVYADAVPVGFAMLHEEPEKAEYFLWRFMIDARYQGMGFGRRAMKLVVDRVKSLPGALELVTSVVQSDDSAQGFYERLGFDPTGEIDDGEVVMKLVLQKVPK